MNLTNAAAQVHAVRKLIKLSEEHYAALDDQLARQRTVVMDRPVRRHVPPAPTVEPPRRHLRVLR